MITDEELEKLNSDYCGLTIQETKKVLARLKSAENAFRLVWGSELLKRDGHNKETCQQPSCVFARAHFAAVEGK